MNATFINFVLTIHFFYEQQILFLGHDLSIVLTLLRTTTCNWTQKGDKQQESNKGANQSAYLYSLVSTGRHIL